MEQAIYQLEEEISDEEKCFETALRLVITWVNRLLFLKLVESQQLSYQNKNPEYSFLTIKKVQDFDELNDLFFKVLGKRIENRDEELQEKFSHVPYLNSSLFEPTEDEGILKIRGIKNRPLELFSQTVLKNDSGKKLTGEMDNLQYFFAFLDSYNFASDSSDEIQNENKTLINASVLGLIFEKINGYKDGSFFTPGFITQYMAEEAIDKVVVQKFNEIKGWKCKNLEELEEEIDDREEANEIINKVHICDPAVGSGHFLVSALNRLLFIKSYLNILLDKNGKRIKRSDWELKLENDEITVVDEDGNRFEYKATNSERQRVQEALFNEKRTIIENCLFGVDLNPNSVYICRLRLWIELLKNTYYTEQSNFTQLETLPNIDINIKCGNSLISKFPIKVGESVLSGKIGDEQSTELKKLIPQYKMAVAEYKRESNKETKRQVVEKIAGIKKSIIGGDTYLFEEYFQDEILASKIFKNSMEWMIEFPEVLNDDGIFEGFDCVIGNPPYISSDGQRAIKKLSEQREYISNCKLYKSVHQKWDLYIPFIELGLTMLCKENGIFAMIIPFPFTNQLYAKEMKKIILENYDLFNLVDLKDVDIFDNATVKNCIPFVKKCSGQGKTWISNIDEKNIIRNTFEQPFTELLQDEKTGVWNVTQEKRDTNKHSNMYVLGDFCYISKGMVLSSDVSGEFTKDDLISITKDELHCKQYIEAKDVEKFKVKRIRYLEFNSERCPSKVSRPTFPEFYEVPKIILNRLGNSIAHIDFGGEYIHNHSLVGAVLWKDLHKVENKSITSSIKKFSKMPREEMEMLSQTVDLRYLLGVLNSKYAQVLINNQRGDDYHIYPEHQRNIPIPTATPDQQNEIIALVDKILEAKKMLNQVQHDTSSADTTELENQIDQKVYELYGLTEEEIKVVEEK